MQRFNTSEADIFQNPHVVTHVVLKDHSDLFAKVFHLIVTKIDPIQQNRAVKRIVKAGK